MNRYQWLALIGISVALAVALMASLIRHDGAGANDRKRTAIGGQAETLQSGATAYAVDASGKADNSQIKIPEKYQFGGSRSINAADDRVQLMAQYTPEQRVTIAAYYAKYGTGTNADGPYNFRDVFSFHSREQLQWLVEQGYPTPDDILAAARLSTQELKAKANAGNFKARMFYLDRLEIPREASMPRESINEDVKRGTATLMLASSVLSEGSPFGAYAYAKYSNAKGSKGVAVASLTFAGMLGDTRPDFVDYYASVNSKITPGEVASGFRLVLSIASDNPSLQNLNVLARRPRFQIYPDEQ